MENENVNVLFYSPKCPYCVECLKLIEPYADDASFLRYVNIHVSRKQLPLRVRRVPTLVLNNGDIIYVGKDVYNWIVNFVDIIRSERKEAVKFQKQQKIENDNEKTTERFFRGEELKNANEDKNSKKRYGSNNNVDAVTSSSSLFASDDENGKFYSSLQTVQTITNTIDYSKVRSVEPEQTKTVLSPDSIQEKRNTELEKIRPHPGRRF